MKLIVDLKDHSYPIYIEKGLIGAIRPLIKTYSKIAIITDTGVPVKWIDLVKKQFKNAVVIRFVQGEKSKNIQTYQDIMIQLIEANFQRSDAIIALGGGVVGDLAGFVAATYMRGIDFYSIPTTVLSQVDSSVGGKTAIDMHDCKNIVGAFYQPKAVFIDCDVLSTLDQRQINNGLFEALKTGLIQDEQLVKEFEKESLDLVEIISRSIDIKRKIVQADEKEKNLRKILNFGHTIGHAIESAYGLDTYYHGECVALGMLFFIEDETLKKRVKTILKRLNCPAMPNYSTQDLMHYITHDKKGNGTSIDCILVKEPGTYTIQSMNFNEIKERLERNQTQ